jgi:hypothetical protein
MTDTLKGSKPILILGKVLPVPSLRGQVELSSRALAAVCLYQRNRCPILTFEAPINGNNLSGSRLVKSILQNAGVATEDIVQKEQSTSTAEELKLARKWLDKHHLSWLRIITSNYHLPRVIQKVKRLNLDGFEVCSPQSIAMTVPNGPFSDVIVSGKISMEVHRRETRVERLWTVADRIASLFLTNGLHERLEITGGRLLRELTRTIHLRHQWDWKSD